MGTRKKGGLVLGQCRSFQKKLPGGRRADRNGAREEGYLEGANKKKLPFRKNAWP